MSLRFNEKEVAEKFDEALPTELPRPVFVKRGDRYKAAGGIYVSVRNATRSVDTIIESKELPLTDELVKSKSGDLLNKWNAAGDKDAKPVAARAAPTSAKTDKHNEREDAAAPEHARVIDEARSPFVPPIAHAPHKPK